ncbi:MAG: DNA starvation/stationary phase protection protein [Elainellaceae cyanobacterium]
MISGFRVAVLVLTLMVGCWLGGGEAIAQPLSRYENPVAQERVPLSPQSRPAAAAPLQATLVELIDLTLSAKQAHWNVDGPLFYSLHQLLQEFAEDYRAEADVVAEQLLALGHTADGRPGVVQTTADLPTFPAGYIDDNRVLDVLSRRLNTVDGRIRDRIDDLDQTDLVTQDVLIEVERKIDEHLWMLRVFQQRSDGSQRISSKNPSGS